MNLSTFSVSPSKKQQTRGVVFSPAPAIDPTTAGGVAFKQPSVLSYLTPVVNLGTTGFICYNWAYNDDDGVTDFPASVLHQGGRTEPPREDRGTTGTAASTGEEVPVVPAGEQAVSAAMNVKNSTIVTNVCPVNDGTEYYTNIFDPTTGVTFDPQNPNTFPPNND